MRIAAVALTLAVLVGAPGCTSDSSSTEPLVALLLKDQDVTSVHPGLSPKAPTPRAATTGSLPARTSPARRRERSPGSSASGPGTSRQPGMATRGRSSRRLSSSRPHPTLRPRRKHCSRGCRLARPGSRWRACEAASPRPRTECHRESESQGWTRCWSLWRCPLSARATSRRSVGSRTCSRSGLANRAGRSCTPSCRTVPVNDLGSRSAQR